MAKSFNFDAQWRTKEKAAELAKFYAENMVPRINYCLTIMRAADVTAKLGSIDPRKMKEFTLNELICLHPEGKNLEHWVVEQVKQVKANVFETCRDQLPFHIKRQSDLSLDNTDRSTFLQKEFWSTVNGVLNDLEYISMCFNSGVADSFVVYQSLHQSFFSVVQVFYFKIASQNSSARDRYYTHVIQLYQTWQNEYQRQADEEASRADQIMSPGFVPVEQ